MIKEISNSHGNTTLGVVLIIFSGNIQEIFATLLFGFNLGFTFKNNLPF